MLVANAARILPTYRRKPFELTIIDNKIDINCRLIPAAPPQKRSLKYCDILTKKCQIFWSIEKKVVFLQKFSIEHERSKQK